MKSICCSIIAANQKIHTQKDPSVGFIKMVGGEKDYEKHLNILEEQKMVVVHMQ